MDIEDAEPEQSKPIQAELAMPAHPAKSARSNFWDSLQDGVAKAIGSNLVYIVLIALLCLLVYSFSSTCSLLAISAFCKANGYDTTGVATLGSSPTPYTQMVPQKDEKATVSINPVLSLSTRLSVKPTADVPGQERFVADRLAGELHQKGYSHIRDTPVELTIEIQQFDLRSRPVTSSMWLATATVTVLVHWAGRDPPAPHIIATDPVESQEEDDARTQARAKLIQDLASKLPDLVR